MPRGVRHFWVILLCCIGCLSAADVHPEPGTLSIMTLNARFLWDGESPEEGSPDISFPWKGSPAKAAAHMEAIAAVIKNSCPDLVNLAEVENEKTLRLFNDRYLKTCGYRVYFIEGTDVATGQDVGLLSRFEPEEGRITRDDRVGRLGRTRKTVSKNYQARFVFGKTRFVLIGVHLLARPLDSNRRAEREAQAEVIRQVALEAKAAGYEPIVLGDLNDFDDDPGSRDAENNRPVSRVLHLIRSMNPDRKDDDLINAAAFVPRSERYTSHHDRNLNDRVDPGEYAGIDHVLLSPFLARKVRKVRYLHAYDPTVVSDHFPILVELQLDAKVPEDAPISVRLISLVPNPTGDESMDESITLQNRSTRRVDLNGWLIRDESGATWKMGGGQILSPGASLTIKRNGQSLALNNAGDTIFLVNRAGKVIQTVRYSNARENETIHVP